jgi:hypothetical protein
MESLEKQKKDYLFKETHSFVKNLFGLEDLDEFLDDQKDLT